MSTVMPTLGPLTRPEPLQETRPGGELPARSAVVIYGRLDDRAIGSFIAVARGFVDDVFVACDLPGSRAEAIARSLGACVIGPSRERSLDAVLAACGTVVAVSGDGTQDPYLIPGLLDCIAGGHDAAIIPSSARDPAENVLLLNNKPLQAVVPGMIALSRLAAGRLKLQPGQDVGQQLADGLEGAGIVPRLTGAGGGGHLFRAHRIGVVVPAYNEERLLEATVRSIPDYVSRIYVIDDGSTDRTPEVVGRLDDPRVVAVRHEANRGVGAAIVGGYRLALRDGMDLVAVMAGDNQMDPAQLPRLLLPVVEGRADYAKGNRLLGRRLRQGMSRWRQLGNGMLTLLNKIASGYWQVCDPQNGYTVISRRALELLDLDAIYTYYGYCNDVLVKLNAFGLRAVDVPMPARYGSERSKIRYGRYVAKVAPMLFRGFLWRLRTKYTVLDFHPLVLFYYAGMLLVPAGALLGMMAVASLPFAAGAAVPLGLAAGIAGLAGLQFLFTAMYLDREADCRGRAGGSR